MTYLIIVMALAMAAPLVIRVCGVAILCALFLMAGLGRLFAVMLDVSARLLDLLHLRLR